MMLASVFLFSTMDVVLKMLVADYGSMQVVFFRCAMALPLFLIWIFATGRTQFRTAYPLGHLLRGALGLGMLYARRGMFSRNAVDGRLRPIFCIAIDHHPAVRPGAG